MGACSGGLHDYVHAGCGGLYDYVPASAGSLHDNVCPRFAGPCGSAQEVGPAGPGGFAALRVVFVVRGGTGRGTR